MTELNEEAEAYVSMFRQNQALQEEYIKNSSRFFEGVTPKEYGLELQAFESKISAECRSAIDSAVSNFQVAPRVHLEALLKAPGDGKFEIRFEPTTGNFSFVTGYYLILNEQATKDIANGDRTLAALTGFVFAADPELLSKATAGIIASALLLGASVITLMDAGKGVYYYMNPLLFYALSLVGLGPAALAGSWVGPLRN